MHKTLKTKVIIACSVALITFIVYLPSLRNEFVNWDDNAYVHKNFFIRSLDAQLLKSAFAEFQASNWHPLTWLSHAIDYALWGLNPLGHHLTNNILHTLNTFLVVLLVIKLLEVVHDSRLTIHHSRFTLIAAATTGLLFGLHPLHVESVAWVSERKDLLCAFFFLLSIMAYTSYATYKSYRTYLLSLCFFVLALLSKPMAVTLPVVLLILDWHLFGRIRSLKTFWTAFVEKLPFVAFALISSVLTMLAQQAGGAVSSVAAIPMATRVIVASQSLIAYLVKMVLPINLVPFYPYPENAPLFSLEHALPIVLVIAITAACIGAARNRKLWLSVWSYYVITLIPVLGIVQVGEQSMADRYAYLPSIGPFLLIGFVAAKVDGKVSALPQRKVLLRTVFMCIAITLLVSLSYATIQQIGVWKNSIVLWKYVIEKEPQLSFAHDNLGDAYSTAGQTDMAFTQYQAAIKLNPYYAEARNNLGSVYLAKGLYDAASEQFRTAIQLKPDFALAHYNLGCAYAAKAQFDVAIEEFRTAISLDPNAAWFHHDLGNAYYFKGQFDMAIEEYRTSLSLDPGSAEVHYNLASAYSSKGQLDLAIEHYRTAVSLKPDFVDAHFNLGICYRDKGSKDMARAEFEVVLTLKPDDHEARQMLNSL